MKGGVKLPNIILTELCLCIYLMPMISADVGPGFETSSAFKLIEAEIPAATRTPAPRAALGPLKPFHLFPSSLSLLFLLVVVVEKEEVRSFERLRQFCPSNRVTVKLISHFFVKKRGNYFAHRNPFVTLNFQVSIFDRFAERKFCLLNFQV